MKKYILSLVLVVPAALFAEYLTYPEDLPALDNLITELENDYSQMKGNCSASEGGRQTERYEVLIADTNTKRLKETMDRFPKKYRQLFVDYWDNFAKIDRYYYKVKNDSKLNCSVEDRAKVMNLYDKHYEYIDNSFMAAILNRNLTSDINLSGKNGALMVNLEEILNSGTRKIAEDKKTESKNNLGDLQLKMSKLSDKLKTLDKNIDDFGKDRLKDIDKFNSNAEDKLMHKDLDYFDAITQDNIDMQLDGDIQLGREIKWVSNKYSKLCFGTHTGRRGALTNQEGYGSGDDVIHRKDQQNICITRHEKWEKERDFWVFYTSDISGLGRNLITSNLDDTFETIKKILRFSAKSLKYIQVICENQDTEISCK